MVIWTDDEYYRVPVSKQWKFLLVLRVSHVKGLKKEKTLIRRIRRSLVSQILQTDYSGKGSPKAVACSDLDRKQLSSWSPLEGF